MYIYIHITITAFSTRSKRKRANKYQVAQPRKQMTSGKEEGHPVHVMQQNSKGQVKNRGESMPRGGMQT